MKGGWGALGRDEEAVAPPSGPGAERPKVTGAISDGQSDGQACASLSS